MPPWEDGAIEEGSGTGKCQYRVLLPNDYHETNHAYPVLYLLHGLFGSFENWTELAGLRSPADLIIVMPDGADGWFCDGVRKSDMFESRIVRRLIPTIEARFRTNATRAGRSIAGNSMGGYGALKIALKFPRLFWFAASLSGAFEAPDWSDVCKPENWEEYRPSILRIFGKVGSRVRMENDLYGLACKADLSELPEIVFNCGTSDAFLPANERLARTMQAAGVPHRFEAVHGGHDWDYWAEQIAPIVRMAAKHRN